MYVLSQMPGWRTKVTSFTSLKVARMHRCVKSVVFLLLFSGLFFCISTAPRAGGDAIRETKLQATLATRRTTMLANSRRTEEKRKQKEERSLTKPLKQEPKTSSSKKKKNY
jgi:hypothetical protein